MRPPDGADNSTEGTAVGPVITDRTRPRRSSPVPVICRGGGESNTVPLVGLAGTPFGALTSLRRTTTVNLRSRHARVAAAVGAVVAAGTPTFMALTAGTASAAEPGRCTETVNVREDPGPDARIVALCEAGKEVELGEERDGVVRLDELGGWAATDHVKADGSGEHVSSSDHDGDHDGDNDEGSSSSASRAGDDDHRGSGRSVSTESGGTRSDDAADGAGDPAGSSGVGGLLG